MFYQGGALYLADVEHLSGNVYCPACSSLMAARGATALSCTKCYTQVNTALVVNWPIAPRVRGRARAGRRGNFAGSDGEETFSMASLSRREFD